MSIYVVAEGNSAAYARESGGMPPRKMFHLRLHSGSFWESFYLIKNDGLYSYVGTINNTRISYALATIKFVINNKMQMKITDNWIL